MFNDKNTERAAIATAIYNRNALEQLCELEPDIFYDLKLKPIYSVMRELFLSGEVVDLISLRQGLIVTGQYDYVGGDAAIAGLAQEYTVFNIDYTIKTLLKYHKRRKLYELSQVIDEQVKNPGAGNDDILNQIAEVVTSLDKLNREEYTNIQDILKGDDPIKEFNITGRYIETGFDALDSRLIGLFKSELIILAARPGCGKTALAVNIATNIARHKHVLFVSLEMGKSQLSLRMLSADTRVDSDLIRRGRISAEEYKRLQDSAKRIKDLKLSISDSTFTLDQIVSRVRQYATKHDAGVVVIDYLQLIQVTSTKNQRYVQVGEISRRLKLLSRELDVPILCLAQVSRAAEDRIPKLSDLRESGDIEQDADVVLFIHKDSADRDSNRVNILFAKNRSGQADTSTEMIFEKRYTRFSDVDYSHVFDGGKQ